MLTRSDYRRLDRELTIKACARDQDFPQETSKHLLWVTPKGDSRSCPELPSTTRIMLPRLLLFVVLCIMFVCVLMIAMSCAMSLIQICMLMAVARCLVLFQLLLTYNQLCLQLHNFLTRYYALQLRQSKQRENLFTHCDFIVL